MSCRDRRDAAAELIGGGDWPRAAAVRARGPRPGRGAGVWAVAGAAAVGSWAVGRGRGPSGRRPLGRQSRWARSRAGALRRQDSSISSSRRASSAAARSDAQAPESFAPHQGLERGGVLRHGGFGLGLIDEHVEIRLARRDRDEDLAVHAERRHVMVWFLADPRQRERERTSTLILAHVPRLAASSGTCWLARGERAGAPEWAGLRTGRPRRARAHDRPRLTVSPGSRSAQAPLARHRGRPRLAVSPGCRRSGRGRRIAAPAPLRAGAPSRFLPDDSGPIRLLFDYLFDILLCKVIYGARWRSWQPIRPPVPGHTTKTRARWTAARSPGRTAASPRTVARPSRRWLAARGGRSPDARQRPRRKCRATAGGHL